MISDLAFEGFKRFVNAQFWVFSLLIKEDISKHIFSISLYKKCLQKGMALLGCSYYKLQLP